VIRVYDTTLRDGMQGEGMSLSVDEKIRVAHALDGLGVHFVEAGFPSSNPKEQELFDLLERETFETSTIAAFGMTRRRDRSADDDEGLRVLAGSFAPVCTLVGKTWSLHLEKVTQVDPEENLRMIAESVEFMAGAGKRVVYDAEHFFDAFRDDAGYALRCLRAAAEAGAENVTLCDTNGSSLPAEVSGAASRVLPTAAGSMCSKVAGSALPPATCMPPWCAKAFLPTYGRFESGVKLSSSSSRCDASVRPASEGTTSSPCLSCRLATIETRFALPQRSP